MTSGAAPGRRARGALLPAAFLAAALGAAAAGAAGLTFPGAVLPARFRDPAVTSLVAAAALAALAAAAAAVTAARRRLRGTDAADNLTTAAALLAMGLSSTGMWAFFQVYVPAIPGGFRVPFFAFLEIGAGVEGLRARNNARRAAAAGTVPAGTDPDRAGMWVLVGFSAFLASMASTTVPEALFRMSPPLVAAWLWERRTAGERPQRAARRQAGDSDGTVWRLAVRRGPAGSSGRAGGEAAARRYLMRAALAACRAGGCQPGTRRHRRAVRRAEGALRAAVRQTDLGASQARQRELGELRRVLDGAPDLIALHGGSPWAPSAAPRVPAASAVVPPDPGDRPGPFPPAAPGRTGRPRPRGREPGPPGQTPEADPGGSTPGGEPPQAPAAGEDEQDRLPGGGAEGQDDELARLARELARAVRGKDALRVHELLSGADDLPALVRLLAGGQFGGKRPVAAAALYARPLDAGSPRAVSRWIREQAGGTAGLVDPAEVRRVRDMLRRGSPGAAQVLAGVPGGSGQGRPGPAAQAEGAPGSPP